MNGPGTYLYAVARPFDEGLLADVRGIGGGELRLLGQEGLTFVVSTVDLGEFAPGPLNKNLEDLNWLERVAREHDSVVQAVAGVTSAVPLRLGTVYCDDESALRRLAGLRPAALATLDVLTGREEWGVKLYAVPTRPPAEVGAAAQPGSGLDYLRQRRAALDRRTLEARAAADEADAVFERLRDIAVLARRHRPQDPVLSGVKHPMLLNAAFLIDRDRVATFQAAVAALADEHPEGAVVLTGPWPAYSFATLDDA
jgi:Gas vesicle synthesis protein GvpL/GvpF